MEVGGRAMGEQAVSLHLPELDPAEPLPVRDGLPREWVHRPSVAELHLVLCHVYQPLVEVGAREDQLLHPFAGLAVENTFSSPS